jgi:hypothetical protein
MLEDNFWRTFGIGLASLGVAATSEEVVIDWFQPPAAVAQECPGSHPHDHGEMLTAPPFDLHAIPTASGTSTAQVIPPRPVMVRPPEEPIDGATALNEALRKRGWGALLAATMNGQG